MSQAAPSPYTTLIAAGDLARYLHEPSWVVVDCRFDFGLPESGREDYTAGHVPGARYAHLDEHLSSPVTPQSGRHPLPDAAVLARQLGTWGIGNQTQVIAYDAGSGAYAARLWWLLRWLGSDRVAVLDGGFSAWTKAGLPVSVERPTYAAAHFIARPRPEMLATTADILATIGSPEWRVLDARAPERFRGDVEPLDTVAGHVPDAGNHPYTGNLDGDGRFLSAPALAVRLQQSLGKVTPGHAIMMCGSGVTACHNLLALEVAGLHGARLYAGSWSEWIRDPSRPVATGAGQA